MNKLSLFLKTARILNLFMLAFVQYIVLSCFVQKFTYLLYASTVLSTILIAFGAYMLNDANDVEIDRHNDKLKWVNNENQSKAKALGFGSIGVGLLIGLSLSYTTSMALFLYYFFASVILISYAYSLSKYKFAGNLLISAVVAMAILLSFYLGVNHAAFTRKFYSFNELGVWVYAGIAFLLNWIREIVKDMEDIEGDLRGKRKSLAIILGTRSSKSIVILVLVFFLAIFCLWIYKYQNVQLEVYLAVLLSLAVANIIQIIRSKVKEDYKLASVLIKTLMLIGLLLPFSEIL